MILRENAESYMGISRSKKIYTSLLLERAKGTPMMKISLFLLLAIFILGQFPEKAYAYLDPGTGSMLIQGLLAFIFSLLTFMGIFWNHLKKYFNRFHKKY